MLLSVRKFSTSFLVFKNLGKNASKGEPVSEFLHSFLVGLIVSGRLAVRHNFNKSGSVFLEKKGKQHDYK